MEAKEAGNVFCSMNKRKWQWQGVDHTREWIINAIISIQKLWITELVLTQKEIWWQKFFFSFHDSSQGINRVEMQSHCCWRARCKCLPTRWIFQAWSLLCVTITHGPGTGQVQCWSSAVKGPEDEYIICKRNINSYWWANQIIFCLPYSAAV